MIVESEWFIDHLGFWMELANKAVQGAFDQKPVFKGLYYIMLQAAEHKEQEKEFSWYHRSISEDAINNLNLCYKNVAQFKRLLDLLHYKGPVVAMTDCTILKSGLQYSTNLDCIVGSTLDRNDCKIETYNDISYGLICLVI
ncbi:hypothetical protein GLOIN_2v1767202 [Rhizophagus irregularis DAOM 181602=DAOM 197198]|nr:hypothetical protein GLOIN_2v1767202 [Rhizophagus irregularis DAOM 181602=DAOM 197198]